MVTSSKQKTKRTRSHSQKQKAFLTKREWKFLGYTTLILFVLVIGSFAVLYYIKHDTSPSQTAVSETFKDHGVNLVSKGLDFSQEFKTKLSTVAAVDTVVEKLLSGKGYSVYEEKAIRVLVWKERENPKILKNIHPVRTSATCSLIDRWLRGFEPVTLEYGDPVHSLPMCINRWGGTTEVQ